MKKAFWTPFLILALASYAYGLKHSTVNDLRVQTFNNHIRIVVDVDASVEFTQNRLSNPDRLYFDLKNCALSKRAVTSISLDNGILNKVRMAQYNRDTVRVVLDIRKSGSHNVFMVEDPHRLVIDVHSSEDDVPPTAREDKSAGPGAVRTTRIVIDPGHGGDDPGAIGPSGVREKDIVLAVGKKIGGILAERPGIEVIYTRDRDVFIPLNERTETANSRKADLFISVHANASPRKNTRGIETYFLNWTDDEEANKVAARENKISFSRMEKMRGDLQVILSDLARKNKNEESMKLASTVQSAMINTLKDAYGGIEDLGVKYAMFYVLVGAEMPSILVEISFISNHEEEKRLSSEQYKDKIAEAIASGINSYMTGATIVAKRTGDGS
ncbi:MAG: N-acetylmuramoyl-L-alanine amidase [Nitrospirae bacterium]|nr:N-acetylmuramoyl-L-alanine amidase [Nitrospirota bacterium]